MRDGWGEWIGGTSLAITAALFVPSLLFTYLTAYPPLPWFFFAIYGSAAVACAIAGGVLLRRGWTLLHQAARAG
jgi:hypothetical protein